MIPRKTAQWYVSGWRVAREGAWGLVAGIVGSLCCIGPSAAILLGLGSSSALFGLQVNRTLALAAGGVIFGLGVLLARHRARMCDLRPHARWRQIALMLTTGALAYGLLGVLAPWAAAQEEQAAAVPALALPVSIRDAPTLRQATLLVAKMDCLPCVTHLRNLLTHKSSVARVAADLGNEEVSVIYDSRQLDPAKLLALIPPPYEAALRDDVALQ